MVEDIAKANDEQNKKLEEQIRIQQESLEYQKEHGLIWQQVYDVMSGTTEEILAFMQGRSTEFFT
jgi:ribosomal protein S12 methylthiotransferase accessory factor YcaO